MLSKLCAMGLVPEISEQAVADAFDKLEENVRPRALELRRLVFDVARKTAGVGHIEETLKWGQPSYLTVRPRSGTTIRIGQTRPNTNRNSGGLALFTHCQTSVIRDFQALFPEDFVYEGNRALHVGAETEIADPRLRMFVQSALTYHLKC